MRSSTARVISTGDSARRRISGASSTAGVKQRSLAVTSRLLLVLLSRCYTVGRRIGCRKRRTGMASKIVTREEMLQRVARFKELTPSARPLVDAVLPQFQREIFNIIGAGVTEDASMKVPITAVDGFHLSIIKAGPKKGTGLHNHTTVEVFVPLTGTWSVQWGDQGENELRLGQWDVISVPAGIMRGFRNESDEDAYMLAIVGGDDPGRVAWARDEMRAARDKGFDPDERGENVRVGEARASRG